MPLVNTSSIAQWPPSIGLAYCEITHHDDFSFLSETEREDLAQLSNDGRKNEFISSRKLLREALIEAGYERIEGLSVHKHELGKPFAILNDQHVYVSFTHTQSHVFCAFSLDVDMGIDAEELSRNVHEGLLNRIIHPSERPVLDVYTPMQLWTIKEAAVKRKGIGIRVDLKQVQVSDTGFVTFEDESRYQFCNFGILNHSIALAY